MRTSLELNQARAYEENEEESGDQNENQEDNQTKENITLDQLGAIISKTSELCDLISELDPAIERRLKVQNGSYQRTHE